MKNRFSNDPREIAAKYNCVCAETGQSIKKGDPCIYYPLERKVYHPNSEAAASYRTWKFDVDVLGANY